jgi:purine-nucleoside/S-methyl-5'-thioadenosine phosphorylase / adenosine deaminase
VSASPYDTANLATHVGDDPDAVRENRARLARDLSGGGRASDATAPDADRWVWLDQRHGDSVVVVDIAPVSPPEADAAVTTRIGLPLVVLTADCAPVALVGDLAVGVVHAGWRGLELGVVARGVEALRTADARAGGDASSPLRAVIGPCIHPERYEFGAADLERLVERFGPTVAATTEWGTPGLDLPAAVEVALGREGVSEIVDVDVCTARSPDCFSHRRDGVTGRQAVVVVRQS